MQPREQAFDFPSTAVAPQRAAILGQSSGARGTVWCNHLVCRLLLEKKNEAVTVVGAIANQPLGEVGEESLFQRGFNEFGFMRRSAGHVHGERKTMAVADCHDFAALTASSRTDGGAPFFAELKLASTDPL